MDNCIIVDNFLHSFDAFEEEVLKFLQLIAMKSMKFFFMVSCRVSLKMWELRGITQPVPRDFVEQYVI